MGERGGEVAIVCGGRSVYGGLCGVSLSKPNVERDDEVGCRLSVLRHSWW
jgi:hypothetical protein